MAGLYYFKWSFDQAQIYEDILTNEQLGELFRAVMDYARDGTEREVSAEILFPYRECKLAVDRSNSAYEKKCQTNKENGAKGGKAKAARSKERQKESNDPKYIPPTKAEFKAMVSHFRSTDGIEADDYEVLKLFDDLTKANWTIGGEPIMSTDELETIILVKFNPDPVFAASYNWLTFQTLFGSYHGCRSENGDCQAESIHSDFWDLFDVDERKWNINNKWFPITEWREALEAYMSNSDASER